MIEMYLELYFQRCNTIVILDHRSKIPKMRLAYAEHCDLPVKDFALNNHLHEVALKNKNVEKNV